MTKKPKERSKREGVMLAYPAEEGRVKRLGEKFFVQPKFRGERCRVEWFYGDPILLSSYNNQFIFLEHIEEALKKLSKQVGQISFDGELYKHGWGQERINSAANCKVNRNSDSQFLEYHIFDIADPKSLQLLRSSILRGIEFRWPLVSVEPQIADITTWEYWLQDYINNGYEGVILRNPSALYTPKRNVALLKYKPTELDEYEIVASIEAVDKFGVQKGTLGAFYVMADGIVFKVGAGKLDHKERDFLWNNRDALVGKTLIVKHELLKTSGGVPLCCVAVEVKGVSL